MKSFKPILIILFVFGLPIPMRSKDRMKLVGVVHYNLRMEPSLSADFYKLGRPAGFFPLVKDKPLLDMERNYFSRISVELSPEYPQIESQFLDQLLQLPPEKCGLLLKSPNGQIALEITYHPERVVARGDPNPIEPNTLYTFESRKRMLKIFGYQCGDALNSGDAKYAMAVRAFQKKNKLEPSGIVDQATRDMLGKRYLQAIRDLYK